MSRQHARLEIRNRNRIAVAFHCKIIESILKVLDSHVMRAASSFAQVSLEVILQGR